MILGIRNNSNNIKVVRTAKATAAPLTAAPTVDGRKRYGKSLNYEVEDIEDIDAAYNAGFDAYDEGKQLKHNPYQRSSDENLAWRDGFIDAQQEEQESEAEAEAEYEANSYADEDDEDEEANEVEDIRLTNSIKLKGNRKPSKSPFPISKPLPWVDDDYVGSSFDVTLTRDELALAGLRLTQLRKPKTKLKAVGKFLTNAGLRINSYFGVTGDGRLWGQDYDAIADNHRELVKQSPSNEVMVTVPKDFRVSLEHDRILFLTWQKSGNGKEEFTPIYTVRFPPEISAQRGPLSRTGATAHRTRRGPLCRLR